MSSVIYLTKSMVRKAREVNNASRKTKKSAVNAIEFLVLLTLPFVLPFFVMIVTVKGY